VYPPSRTMTAAAVIHIACFAARCMFVSPHEPFFSFSYFGVQRLYDGLELLGDVAWGAW
jgi:hypothetical protein